MTNLGATFHLFAGPGKQTFECVQDALNAPYVIWFSSTADEEALFLGRILPFSARALVSWVVAVLGLPGGRRAWLRESCY